MSSSGASRAPGEVGRPLRLLFVLNEAYFLLSHRGAIVRGAKEAGFEIHVAAPPHHAWAPPGFDVSQLEQEGVTFHPIPMSRRGMNPFGELQTFFALWRLYRRLRPDLVHHVTIKPNLYGGIAARLAGVPAVVYAVTGLGHLFASANPPLAFLRPAVVAGLRLSLNHRNARVIFQNRDDRDLLVSAGAVSPDRCVVLGGAGVDLGLFARLAPPSGTPLVVLASRLIWDKGVGVFVEAARALRREGVTARFALVGGTHASNPQAVPEATLKAWVAEGVVEWWGYRTDMPDVLERSHVVCLPSSYGEGVPKVLLEAAAAARPVVASDIPGCRDAVVAGVTGLLVPPGDAAALGIALRRLIENPDQCAAMGVAARQRAQAEFDERSVVKRTMAIYRLLLTAPQHVGGSAVQEDI